MIVVPGSINLDLIARVERLPAPGETVRGPSFVTAPGGKGANQALAARRAGAEVAMIGAVGADAQADGALELLRGGGVDLSRVKTVADISTGVALIMVDHLKGENVIAVVAGANGRVAPADVTARKPETGDIVLLQMEIPAETVSAALRHAGATSVLNIAPYTDDVPALAPLADIVVANETEFDLMAAAMRLPGDDRAARMRAFVEKSGNALVVTLGPDGAVALTGDGEFRAAAPVIETVDTVGAGDTFCGYLAAGLAEGMAWPDALDLAVRAGAATCLKPGAQPAIPYRSEL
ncbi:PfkB family carbohydrate kinase [Oricola nitratireducens]|uniref:PfkB family carbohydrate kinase n=1 Tax=Oricola nitratireducens TaxID=2775868 RepID=UPI0018680EFD